MSFREKSAWISFVSILVTFAIYFTAVWMSMTGRLPPGRTFSLFFQLVVVLIILHVVLHIIVALRAPRDARTPEDERERLISLRADRVAAYTLAAGVFGAIYTVHLGASARDVAHAALLAFVVAQLAKYATEIALHRRDA